MTKDTFASRVITGKGFRTLAIYRLFFKAALADVRENRAQYDAEVEEWYTEGDGRPVEYQTVTEDHFGETYTRRVNVGGQGHAFPYCIHGTSLWTDYDNICYGCEESLTAVQEAQGIARERFVRFNDRWDWLTSAPGDLDYDTRRSLEQWVLSLLPGQKG